MVAFLHRLGRGLSVGQKLLGIVFFCLALLVATAGTGLYQLVSIGGEIEAVAEQDMPLTKIITKITVHQLAQAILFERAVRFGEEAERDAAKAGVFKQTVAAFTKMGHEVSGEIIEGENIARAAVKNAHTAAETAEFKKVLKSLEAIETAHKTYDKHAAEVFAAFAAHDLTAAMDLARKTTAEEKALDHELEALLAEIEGFTGAALLRVEDHEKQAIRLVAILTLVAAAGGLALAIWVSRAFIVKPLSEVVDALLALKDGDTSVEVTVRAEDEIGAVARAFSSFRENTIRMQELTAEQEAERKAQEERARHIEQLTMDFDTNIADVIGTVVAAAQQMTATAGTMTKLATDTSERATAVSAATEQASANVQTVASASEELSASVNEISSQIVTSADTARSAVESASQASAKIQSLVEASQKVGDVLTLIDDIAGQTNLLALNATIEAARAGEAGKGFAVVASEVKSLASQTGQATEEIAGQIEAMRSATGDTVKAIEEISQTIANLNDIASAISAAVEEQGAATGEISRNAHEAAAGTEQVSENIAGVSGAASETGTSAAEVHDAAEQLSERSEYLRGVVDSFLREVCAA